MAVLIIDGEQEEIPDGEAILPACVKLGVPTGCHAGICGTCVLTIEEGMENLAPKNGAEQTMRLEPNERLACQAKIVSGTVVASW